MDTEDPAPPYPGPPANYAAAPPPGMYPQPGFVPAGAPPPAYQAAYPYTTPTMVPVTVQTGHVIVTPELQDIPGQTVCPNCHQSVTTNTKLTPGWLTWFLCCFLVFLGGILCFWIPFCVDSCQDVKHSCPSCNKAIYIHKRV